MPEAASTRLGLVAPSGTDDINLGDDILRALRDQLEDVVAGFIQGTSRPAASMALKGYIHFHTGNGNLSYCTGSGWTYINSDIALSRLAAPITEGDFLWYDPLDEEIKSAWPPGKLWGYDEITSNVVITSSTEASGTTIINGSAYDFDGAPVLAEFFAPGIVPDSGGSYIISLFEGSTQIGRLCGGNVSGPAPGRLQFTPSDATHTYTVKGHRVANTATVLAGAGGTGAYVPAFLRFTKV